MGGRQGVGFLLRCGLSRKGRDRQVWKEMQLQLEKTAAEEELAQHFAALSAGQSDEDWAARQRRAGWQDFVAQGLPHRRVEEWKYTDLRNRLKQAYAPAEGAQAELGPADVAQALGEGLAGFAATRLVFVDGQFVAQLSDANDLGGGVEIISLASMLAAPLGWFKQVFGTVNPYKKDMLLPLNTAFMRDGAVIRVPDNVEVEKPLHLVFINSAGQPASVATRNLVLVGRGAKLTLLESYCDLSGAAVQGNHVTEMLVGPKAKVRHLKFQNESEDSVHLSTWMARVGRLANYNAFQFSLGGQLARNQLYLTFDGEAASVGYNGAALLRGRQHCDTTMVVDHATPGCVSRELFKTVLDGEARAVFQGKVVVQRGAQKTDGQQMARALLLSERAEFDAKPELEIYADDVLCGHGATSGELDADMMFYLRSRGVPEEQARSMLITAFIGEVLDAVEDEALRAVFSATVCDRLGCV